MTERIRCPNPVCPQPDDVQKVSVVVQSGTIEGLQRFSTGTYSVASSLSQQLAPPVRPENKGRWGVGSIFWMGFFLLGIISFIVLFIVVGHGPQGPDAPPPAVPPLLFLSLIGGAVWLIVYKSSAASAFKGDYARYLAARAKWDQLFYCKRCGSVFNPNKPGRFVPTSRMNELLT